MTNELWLLTGALLLAWCLIPLPLALAVGRAFRAGRATESAVPALSLPSNRELTGQLVDQIAS